MGLWACGLGRKVRADVAAVGERAKEHTSIGIRGLARRSFDAICARGRPLAGGIRSLLAIVGMARMSDKAVIELETDLRTAIAMTVGTESDNQQSEKRKRAAPGSRPHRNPLVAALASRVPPAMRCLVERGAQEPGVLFELGDDAGQQIERIRVATLIWL